jgi:hypothetical protein
VYPGEKGDLTAVDFEKREVRLLPAHEGPFYAAVSMNGHAVTVGQCDGTAVVWNSNTFKAMERVAAPLSCVSGGVHGYLKDTLVLADASGQAGVWEIRSGGMRLTELLPVEDARTILGVDTYRHGHELDSWRDRETSYLAANIRAYTTREDHAAAEPCYERLARLSGAAQALRLRAELAEARGDLLAAVHCRLKGLEAAAGQSNHTGEDLAAAVKALVRLGQPRKALEVCSRYAPNGHASLTGPDGQLGALAEAAEKGEVFYHTGLSLELHASAADMLGVPLMGRYCLDALQPLVPVSAWFSPEELGTEWDQVYSEYGSDALSEVSRVPLWVVSATEFSIQDTLVISYRHNAYLPRFELTALLETDGRRTAVHSILTLSLPGADVTHPAGLSSGDILCDANRFRQSGTAKGWIRLAYQSLEQAVRRLVYRAAPDLFGEKGSAS